MSRPEKNILTWTGPDGKPMKTEIVQEVKPIKRPNSAVHDIFRGLSIGEIVLFGGSAGYLISRGEYTYAGVPLVLVGAGIFFNRRLGRMNRV